MRSDLVNFAGYQVTWFTCILGARAGRPWEAAAGGAVPVALHLGLLDRSPSERRLVLGALAAGWILETANLHLGVTSFPDLPGGLPLAPAWMGVLWAAFAATLRHSLRRLLGRPGPAALLGALAGPLSFAAGERLGALSLGGPAALATLAAEWALAMAILCRSAPGGGIGGPISRSPPASG